MDNLPAKPTKSQRVELTAKQKKALAIALSTGNTNALIKEFQNNKATHNRNVTARVKEGVLVLLSMGWSVKEAAETLGVSAALVRQHAYHDPVFKESYDRARELGADADFDQMKEIAHDTSLPVADRRLIIEVLEKRAKAFNRKAYGDKVQVDNSHKFTVVMPDDINDVI